MEEAGAETLLGDDKEHPAHDAASSLGILEGQNVSFSQSGLAISERDKLQMKIDSRRKVSFSWAQAQQIVEHVGKMDRLGKARREQYATLFLLAAASGLRTSELFALRANNLDFAAGTIRVEESSDQRSAGKIGPCKNVTAYRTVLLRDPEGRRAMQRLKRFLGTSISSHALVFRSKRGGPLRETYVLNQCLHPALKALGLKKAGLQAFRRGCNRRWELAGINPAVMLMLSRKDDIFASGLLLFSMNEENLHRFSSWLRRPLGEVLAPTHNSGHS